MRKSAALFFILLSGYSLSCISQESKKAEIVVYKKKLKQPAKKVDNKVCIPLKKKIKIHGLVKSNSQKIGFQHKLTYFVKEAKKRKIKFSKKKKPRVISNAELASWKKKPKKRSWRRQATQKQKSTWKKAKEKYIKYLNKTVQQWKDKKINNIEMRSRLKKYKKSIFLKVKLGKKLRH